MALTQKEISQVREYLDNYKDPFFFYHDDPDGVCSYLLFYRYMKEGKGMILKNTPEVSKMHLRKIQEHDPDIIFILDLAMVEQDFLDNVKVPVVWIDHHGPFQREKVRYFNPRKRGSHEPASYLCHQVTGQDLWISVLGCIGDWFIPDTIDEFRKKYPGLVPKDVTEPQKALFETKAGEIVHMISMILKGDNSVVRKNIRALGQIQSPNEILEQSSEPARRINKRFEYINKKYRKLLDSVLKSVDDSRFLIHIYPETNISFTKEVSNYLLYRFPEKIVVLGRRSEGQAKLSLRSSTTKLPPLLEKAFKTIPGRGGGHEYACGAVVPEESLDEFLDFIKTNA